MGDGNGIADMGILLLFFPIFINSSFAWFYMRGSLGRWKTVDVRWEAASVCGGRLSYRIHECLVVGTYDGFSNYVEKSRLYRICKTGGEQFSSHICEYRCFSLVGFVVQSWLEEVMMYDMCFRYLKATCWIFQHQTS